jgi:hypothetical protein
MITNRKDSKSTIIHNDLSLQLAVYTTAELNALSLGVGDAGREYYNSDTSSKWLWTGTTWIDTVPYLYKKITGTTGGASAITNIAHGLTLAKIVSVTVFINYNVNTQRMFPCVDIAGFLYYVYFDATNVYLDLQTATSLATQSFTILITYEK